MLDTQSSCLGDGSSWGGETGDVQAADSRCPIKGEKYREKLGGV